MELQRKIPFNADLCRRFWIAKSNISGTEQTAALGAAIYASVAAGKDLGGYETIQEAVANMSHLKDIVYKPNPPMVEKYVELYQMYCNLVEMFNPQKNTTMITLSQLH